LPVYPPNGRAIPAVSAWHSRAADSTSVSRTPCRSNVARLMALSTSAVAACCCSVSSSSRVFAASCSASVVAEASFRLTRVLFFASAERVRPSRLRPLTCDFPRLICRRPMDSVGRNANLPHLSCLAHASERPARNRNTYNKIASHQSSSSALLGAQAGL
jgi:hypothetical protein